MPGATSPIDWARAERVGVAIATRNEPRPAPGATDEWAAPIARIEQQIEDVTGLRSTAGPAQVQLIDRAGWVRANVGSFQRLLGPVFERFAERGVRRQPPARIAAASRQIAGAEIGALLGWMATRVLGQYDLFVRPDESDGPADAVYLVAPNLAGLERRFGFDPHQFRTWVLVHELTHRAQFTGVPWMRGHFTALVDESLAFVNPDPQVIVQALKERLRSPRDASQHVRDHGIVGLIAGPAQRAVIARIGGLMSLLEGHGDVTMTRAAGDLVPDAERYARVLAERRRRANPVTKLVLRLTGLEAKLEQYAAGERFIAALEAAGGPRLVDRCWTSPEALPTLEEIREPVRWLTRMGALVA